MCYCLRKEPWVGYNRTAFQQSNNLAWTTTAHMNRIHSHYNEKYTGELSNIRWSGPLMTHSKTTFYLNDNKKISLWDWATEEQQVDVECVCESAAHQLLLLFIGRRGCGCGCGCGCGWRCGCMRDGTLEKWFLSIFLFYPLRWTERIAGRAQMRRETEGNRTERSEDRHMIWAHAQRRLERVLC